MTRHPRSLIAVRYRARGAAFTLVELVLVILIIGVLAAMAIPRLSRGSTAATEAALAADMRVLRDAIMTYAIEHNGSFPGPDAAGFAKKLTQFTSASGACSPTRTATNHLGPYLNAIPPCPSGENVGSSDVLISNNSPPAPNSISGQGWVYNPATGEILPNSETAAVAVPVEGAEPGVGLGP